MCRRNLRILQNNLYYIFEINYSEIMSNVNNNINMLENFMKKKMMIEM